MTKKYAGGRPVSEGEWQSEAHTGRKQNQAAKEAFSTGPHARTDPNAGRPNGPLIPMYQVPVKPQKKGSTDGE